MVVSALHHHELAETALDLAAYDYVTKPFTSTDLLITISNALRRRAREYKLQFRQEALEEAIDRHRAAFEEARERLEESVRELRFSQEDTVHRLFRALRVRHGETAGHLARVSAYCALIAERIGFAPERVERIRVASMLHDVGKIAVPDRILEKPGTLSGEERAVVERHAIVGHELLAGSRFEVLDLAATIAYTHHERFDGTGYPRGLEGEQTPVEGRIAAVADVFDAVTYDRAYQRAMSVEVAMQTLRAERGEHFDPVVLDAFLESPRAIAKIMERTRDADEDDLEELAQARLPPGD